MGTLQKRLFQEASNWLSNYAERPSKLFSGAEVLLTILISAGHSERHERYTTGLRKWSSEQRANLFSTTSYAHLDKTVRGFVLPKFSSEVETSITAQIFRDSSRVGGFLLRQGDGDKTSLFYRIGGGRYWKIFTTQSPRFVLNGKIDRSSRENRLIFSSEIERDLACSLFSSSLFFWFFSITSNGRDMNPIDLSGFPVDLLRLAKQAPTLLQLSRELMDDYQKHSKIRIKESRQTGTVEYQEFYPRLSKDLIDEIDVGLAHYFGFSSEQLDFIVNYDVKYRMGQEGKDGDD